MGPELTAGFCHQMSELTGLYLGSDGMPLLKATYAEFFFPSSSLSFSIERAVCQCGNLANELLLLIFLANGAPCSPFSVPLSATFFLPCTGCQAALTMNQSFFFGGRVIV